MNTTLRSYKPIMLMGCTSDAGKSFLCAALCRHFSNMGLRVAPFKAQNMSNNAGVTAAGEEIGRAQYFQALAARVMPEARMQPVLLKPQSDTQSQVIVMGRVDAEIGRMPWMNRRPALWAAVHRSLHSLLRDFELVIIEGAGSPAEINLRDADIVNMRVALEADADVYLVADIDRGGAFAHLLGTMMCLTPEERGHVKGFVLNKFRGDPALLGNAMDWLQAQTGVATVAIVPMLKHLLPEEDNPASLANPAAGNNQPTSQPTVQVALVAYPYASNFDEFDPLRHEPGVVVNPIREREPLDAYDAVVLPGSKNTAASLRYLLESGLAAEVSRAARRGCRILGICGGMQMLGRWLRDPDGLEGGEMAGLGLLDLVTTLMPYKVVRQRDVRWLEGGQVTGYEIHHGQTTAGAHVRPHLEDMLGWQQENVCGIYLHDVFKNTAYRQHWLMQVGWRGTSIDWGQRLDADLDRVSGEVMAAGWGQLLRPKENSA